MIRTIAMLNFSLLLMTSHPSHADKTGKRDFVRIIPYTNAVIQCREVNPYLTAQEIDDCVKKLRQGFSAKEASAQKKERRTLRQ